METRKIFCLIGSSGSGKSTIARVLSTNHCPELISHTTREPRVNEKDGVNYYFITEEEYNKLAWVEKETYCGKRYGSAVNEVLGKLADNDSVCVAVTYKGYESYLKFFNGWQNVKVISIFVDGGSEETLIERLTKRGDKKEDIRKRVEKYRIEQEDFKSKHFDMIFDNTGSVDDIKIILKEKGILD